MKNKQLKHNITEIPRYCTGKYFGFYNFSFHYWINRNHVICIYNNTHHHGLVSCTIIKEWSTLTAGMFVADKTHVEQADVITAAATEGPVRV